jgi:two-component system NtrC family sensor kinase
LEKINKGAHLCWSVTEKFLPFSRKQDKKHKYVQINNIIDSAIGLTKDDFEADDIQLIKHLAEDVPDMAADFYELQKVFMNMIYNAHQAMEELSGKKRLTVKSEFDDKTIRISFQDTGQGIPKVHLQKVFEPLFTTREDGKGTGLGLSVCYEIIKKYKGNIYVTSEPGKGAHFVIDLPIFARAS